MFRVLMTAMLLFVVIRFRQPCADAVGQFVAGYDEQQQPTPPETQAGQVTPQPGGQGFIEITPDMSDKDIEKAFQELKAQAAQRKAASPAAPATVTPPATP
ncbi:MAG: hypothetical protein IPL79_05010 [Myxococcales bacterium]|nr:hypothetical protein [Myxococcales bacterium]